MGHLRLTSLSRLRAFWLHGPVLCIRCPSIFTEAWDTHISLGFLGPLSGWKFHTICSFMYTHKFGVEHKLVQYPPDSRSQPSARSPNPTQEHNRLLAPILSTAHQIFSASQRTYMLLRLRNTIYFTIISNRGQSQVSPNYSIQKHLSKKIRH